MEYWIVNLSDHSKTIEKRNDILYKIKTVDDIKRFMWKFNYKDDEIQYEQNINTIVHNNFNGDCEDIANLFEFLFNSINIDTTRYYLFNKENSEGHIIIVTNNKKYFSDGKCLYSFKSDDIEKELYDHFFEYYDWYMINNNIFTLKRLN